jgi:hypothetical protein
MTDELQVEVGRVREVPTCPDNIQVGLRDFDSRLRCVFNTRRSVWEVQEQLKSSGKWSHVFFWHDGPWNAPAYRPLPFTAEPLIARLREIDLQRSGTGLRQFNDLLEAEGAEKRARLTVAARAERAKKLEGYLQWMRRRLPTVLRRFELGGRPRLDAMQERQQALNDLSLRPRP